MIRIFRLGESARIAAFPDSAGIHLVMVAGASKLAMQLAEPTARALNTELHAQLPPGAPVTRRPALPQRPPGDRTSNKPDWSRILARLRSGTATPNDAEHVAALLNYLGFRPTP